VLAFTEVCSLIGSPFLPILPPWGTGAAAAAMRRIGLQIPPEMLNQLRFGRGLDNRRFKATGFVYRYTTRETVMKLGEHLRLKPILAGVREPYRYEREVEEFLRWSPYVRRGREEAGPGGAAPPMPTIHQLSELQKFLAAYAGFEGAVPAPVPKPARAKPATPKPPPAPVAPVDDYDDLESEEIISLIGSLERDALTALRDYEQANRAREPVVRAIEAVLAREPSPA
jgi:UDP-glucose 4-epimerase